MTELSDQLQTTLGDAFRIAKEMKAGGMSRLFLATESSLNRQVVVKVLPPEFTSEVSIARFKQEMELTAHLQHPHILPVLTAGSSGDLLYYIMPYVANESLRDRMNREGRLPVEFALTVMTEVADALAHANEKGVVHRDLKPENILLEGDHAVLADFGIARALLEVQEGERLTGTGLSVGTPGYMSPEQAAGDRNIDARADIYALAVVGYEMLTGTPPFDAPTPQAVLAAHLTETPKPVSEIRTATPPAVSGAIARALAKDPADRFQTAAEFRDTIKQATQAPKEQEPSRRRIMMLAGAAAVVLAGLFLLWPRGPAFEGDPRKSLVVFPFQNRTADPENDWLQEASMNLLGLGLAHWEDLRVFDDERTASLMRRNDVEDPQELDFDAAQSMAREARVGTLVLGDIRREGDSLAFEAKVHDVTSGERIATEIVRTGRSTDPRPLFDSLTARILQVSGAPPGERPGVVAQTTRSLDAYRAYVSGRQALQVFALDSAEARFTRAVELDSTFALAYIGLVSTEGWRLGAGDVAKRRQFVAKAEAFVGSLPQRFRLLVQVHAAITTAQYRQARSIAEQLIARDSGDVEAWYQLGEAHYHHESLRFPHPDTLGNLGMALASFRRTLALDPSYTLAYLHAVEALGNCNASFASHVCLADSAAYGEPAELIEWVGAGEIARLRQAAADSQVATAYAWVSAAPNAVLARETLVQVLLQQRRHQEATAQLSFLRNLGLESPAMAYESLALLIGGRYREAAERGREALAEVTAEQLLAQFNTYGSTIFALATAGHVDEALEVLDSFFAALPFPRTFPVAFNGVSLPKEALAKGVRLDVLANMSADTAEIIREAREWFSAVRSWVRDTVDYRRVMLTRSTPGTQAVTSPYLTAYLTSRDTTILAHFLEYAEADRWQSARAHLALSRGDTAQARDLLARHFDPANVTVTRVEEYTEVYAWADLLSRVGSLQAAREAYDVLDGYEPDFLPSGPNVVSVGLMIRSWGERGALYQELGDRDKAIEMYEKLIDVWQDGDRHVQPFVERARSALASLRGEVAPIER